MSKPRYDGQHRNSNSSNQSWVIRHVRGVASGLMIVLFVGVSGVGVLASPQHVDPYSSVDDSLGANIQPPDPDARNVLKPGPTLPAPVIMQPVAQEDNQEIVELRDQLAQLRRDLNDALTRAQDAESANASQATQVAALSDMVNNLRTEVTNLNNEILDLLDRIEALEQAPVQTETPDPTPTPSSSSS